MWLLYTRSTEPIPFFTIYHGRQVLVGDNEGDISNGGNLATDDPVISLVPSGLLGALAFPLHIHESNPDGLIHSHDTLPRSTAPKHSAFNLLVCSFPNGRPNSYPTGKSPQVKAYHASSKGVLGRAGRIALSSTHSAK